MAHTFQLAYGSTTLNLDDGSNYRLMKYSPADGDSEEIVSEPIEVEVMGASYAALAANLAALQMALRQAERFQARRLGDRVLAILQPDGYASAFRTELHGGKLTYDNDVLGYEWLNKRVRVLLTWARSNWWEDNTERAITLTARGSSGTTLNLKDACDATRLNFVDNSTSISGDMPAPLKLKIDNTFVDARPITQILIGQFVQDGAAGGLVGKTDNVDWVLEGEDATGDVLGGTVTPTVDTACSGGNYGMISWSGTNEVNLCYWFMPASAVVYAGKRYAVIARLRTPTAYTDLWTRLRLAAAGAGTLFETELRRVEPNNGLQIIGYLDVPPGYINDPSTTYSTLSLWLRGKRNTSGSHGLQLDYLYLCPADAVRVIRATTDNTIPQSSTLYDDQIEGYIYQTGGIGARINLVATGAPLAVWPGRTNRLVLFQSRRITDDPVTYGSVPDATIAVTAWYRPRRRTL